MKMSCFLAGALLVTAFALPTAFAQPATQGWSNASGVWGAGSTGIASATAALPGRENAKADLGDLIDTDTASSLTSTWTPRSWANRFPTP